VELKANGSWSRLDFQILTKEALLFCLGVNYDAINFQEKPDETVDLSTDTTLLVDISDALSEKDKVKFTVHTKVS